MDITNFIPADPAVLASLTIGQLLSIPAIRSRFSPNFVSTLTEHQLTMTLDKLEPAFLFLVLKDFLSVQSAKSSRQQRSDNEIIACPFCNHTFFIGD